MVDPRVTSAVRAGGVEHLDERGLMPLATARALLADRSVFEKGEGRMQAGLHVLDSDLLWAALLSLEDAAEFVREASRLEWRFHPRGMENLDLFHRYGEGLVPWLATRVDARGRLVNVPWCVLPCLLACSSDAAFSLAWEASDDRGEPLKTWLARHPRAGLMGSAGRAARGDARARELCVGAMLRGQREELERALDTLEPAAAASLRRDLGLAGELSPAAILAHLDACAEGAVHRQLQRWPRLDGDGPLLFHGMRLVGARGLDGSWGVLLERLQGSEARGMYPAHIAQHAYGNRVPGGVALTSRPLPNRSWPAKSAAFITTLRRELTRSPADYWTPASTVMGRLALGDGAAIIVDCHAFFHAEGSARGHDGKRSSSRIPPSRSPAFASLAEALVHRDPTRFNPGKNNVVGERASRSR
ncbi:MAG: hypothetical protein U0271_02925 [Polyangiaceae bacterium]